MLARFAGSVVEGETFAPIPQATFSISRYHLEPEGGTMSCCRHDVKMSSYVCYHNLPVDHLLCSKVDP